MPQSSSQFHTTTPISHHIVTFHIDFTFCNIPHSTPRHIPHHTFCFSITPCLKLQHSTSVAPHFTYTDITSHHNSHQSNHPTTSRRTIPHHAHIPPHTTPCTSTHSNINCTSHYPTARCAFKERVSAAYGLGGKALSVSVHYYYYQRERGETEVEDVLLFNLLFLHYYGLT